MSQPADHGNNDADWRAWDDYSVVRRYDEKLWKRGLRGQRTSKVSDAHQNSLFVYCHMMKVGSSAEPDVDVSLSSSAAPSSHL